MKKQIFIFFIFNIFVFQVLQIEANFEDILQFCKKATASDPSFLKEIVDLSKRAATYEQALQWCQHYGYVAKNMGLEEFKKTLESQQCNLVDQATYDKADKSFEELIRYHGKYLYDRESAAWNPIENAKITCERLAIEHLQKHGISKSYIHGNPHFYKYQELKNKCLEYVVKHLNIERNDTASLNPALQRLSQKIVAKCREHGNHANPYNLENCSRKERECVDAIVQDLNKEVDKFQTEEDAVNFGSFRVVNDHVLAKKQ